MSATAANERQTQAQTLDALYTQVANLEIRIFGGQLPRNRLIPIDKLQTILQRTVEGEADSTRLDLSGAVKKVIEGDGQTSGASQLLSIRHAALLQIVETLFRYLEYAADLDPDAYGAIQHLQVALAQLLVIDPGALTITEHPARRFLEHLVSACKSYDRHAGPKAEVLLQQVKRLVKSTATSTAAPDWAFGSAQRELTALLDEHEREILELAKGMIAKEQGEMKSNDAKLAVNREIIDAVKGKKLPLILLQFLQRIWNKYLYVTHLRHGMNSAEWRQGVEDIHALVHSLTIRDRNELFKFYSDDRAKALARIRIGAASIHGDEELGERFFATLDRIHKQVGEGKQPVVQETKVSASNHGAGASTTSNAGAGSEIALGNLRVGHWYKLLDRGMEVRCKLIEKNPEHAYCLFSNYSGIKTARMEYSEVAQALQEGALKQIDTAPIFDKALAFACRQLAEQIPKLESKARTVEQERAKILTQKHQVEAREKLRRLEEERLREEARLLEESRAREQEQARQQAQSRVEAQQQARERALQQILSSVNKMQPGGWVELIQDGGRKVTCKLGLRLKSSRKLIFVDHLGRKVQELLPEQLAERIIEGSAAIADYGVAFDDTLGRLITDRSEQVHAEQSK